MITFTVNGSTISVRAIVLSSEPMVAFVSGLIARSSVNLTDSALKSSPLWNLTPLRSANCQVVGFTRFHDSASAGTRLPCASRAVSPSKTLTMKIWVLRPTVR